MSDATFWLRPDETVRWRIATEHGEITGSGNVEEMQAACQTAGIDEARLVVATELALASQVSVPARSRGQFRKALPFAVEEKLAVDLDSTHIALGGITPGEPTTVRVVSSALLTHWIDALDEAGVTLKSAQIDADLVPRAPDEDIAVFLDGGRALLRTVTDQAIAIPVAQLGLALSLAVKPLAATSSENSDDEDAARNIRLWCAPDNVPDQLTLAEWSSAAAEADIPVNFRIEHFDEPLDVLIRNNDAPELLQGAFEVRGQGELDWRVWKMVAYAALAWFAIHLGVTVAQASWYEEAADQARAEAETVFKNTFPGERPRGNLRRRADRLAGATASNSGGFVGALGDFATAAQSARGASLNSLSYQRERDELALDLVVREIDTLESLRNALGEAYTVEVVTVDQDGDRQRARLKVARADGA